MHILPLRTGSRTRLFAVIGALGIVVMAAAGCSVSGESNPDWRSETQKDVNTAAGNLALGVKRESELRARRADLTRDERLRQEDRRQARLRRQREERNASRCYTSVAPDTEAERQLHVLVLPTHRSEYGSPGGHGGC